MKTFFIILIFFFSLKSNAQFADKELKHTGSLIIPEQKKISDTLVHTTFHCPSSYSFSQNNPLLIINGKRKPFDTISQIDAKSVEAVSVMKGPEAFKKYGRKARSGVIIITMKKA